MSASERVSLDFHRLGLLFAGIAVLLGAFLALFQIVQVNQQSAQHEKILCAHAYLQEHEEPRGTLFDEHVGYFALKTIGCSHGNDRVRIEDARNPPEFTWSAAFFLCN